jgi:ATP-dependent helicase HepA
VANILLDTLLDRHGTGRSLFRNTRQKIKGFPQRKLHAYPLTAPEQYEKFNEITILKHLQPEHLFRQYHDYSPQWWQVDPRFDWLIERLNYYTDEKILLI